MSSPFSITVLISGLGMVAAGRGAHAAEGDLDWVAPAGCPDAGDVARRSRNVPGGGNPTAHVTARAHVRQAAKGRWHVHIDGTIGDERWTRDLEAETCDALAEATALLVAIARSTGPRSAELGVGVETTASEEPSTSGVALSSKLPLRDEPVEAARTSAVSAPAEAAAAESAQDRAGASKRPSSFMHSLRVAPMLSIETASVPTPAPGMAIAIAWAPSMLRAELDAGAWMEGSATLPSNPEAGGRFRLVAARARVCATPRWGRLSAGPCAGLEIDHVTAEGFGGSIRGSNDATWLSASPGVLGALHVTPWLAVRATLDATVPLERTSFVIVGRGSVHRVANAGPRPSLGIELQLP